MLMVAPVWIRDGQGCARGVPQAAEGPSVQAGVAAAWIG